MKFITRMIMFTLLIGQMSCYSNVGENSIDNNISKNTKDLAIKSNWLGTWSSDEYDENALPISTFTVNIESLSNSDISGTYCYVSNYGKKTNCNNSFTGKHQAKKKNI